MGILQQSFNRGVGLASALYTVKRIDAVEERTKAPETPKTTEKLPTSDARISPQTKEQIIAQKRQESFDRAQSERRQVKEAVDNVQAYLSDYAKRNAEFWGGKKE